jgi:hypothetical protein
MCGLRPPARVGYDFLSDGPAGERSSPLQAYNEILEIPCGDCRGGLQPPARVGYDFLSDGPAGERSSPIQAYNEILEIPCGDCRGGLQPPARACYVILGNGQAAGRRVLEVAPTASDVMPFVWRPIAGRPYGLAGSIWISDKLGPGIEKGS